MTEVFRDYAHHLLTVERLTREAHDACLDRDYAHAQGIIRKMQDELIELSVSLIVMHEEAQRLDKARLTPSPN